jgi:hypothetical protein
MEALLRTHLSIASDLLNFLQRIKETMIKPVAMA